MLWTMFLLIFLPRLPLVGVSGSTSPIRIDHLGLIPVLFLGIPILFRKSRSLLPRQGVLALIIWAGFHLIVGNWNASSILAMAFYFALFLNFVIGKDLVENGALSLPLLCKFLFVLGFLNACLHLISLAFGWHISASYQTDMQVLTYGVYGKYGAFGQPYSFCAFLILAFNCGLVWAPSRLLFLSSPFYLLAVITSDSRIGALCFFLALLPMVHLLQGKRRFLLIVLIVLTVVGAILIGGKVGSLTQGDVEISSDPSAAVRIENAIAYYNRLNFLTFFFGFGILGFLSFVVQYGEPGTFDNLYLRIASEFGVALLVYFLILLILFLKKIYYHPLNAVFCKMIFIVICSTLLISFLNETVISSKFGYAFWFLIGAGAAVVSASRKAMV